MRAIWSGTIAFGLVNIPVKLFSATQSSELNLDMLDKKDLSNIRYMRVNEKTGREVPWENIVKGYMYDDRYVVVSQNDFEAAGAKKTKMIEISEFVDALEVDPIYYEKPFYIAPEKSGERAYALLREALSKTGKAGVSTFVLRNKEALAILRANNDVIVLNRIRFEEEIRDTVDLNLPEKAEVKKSELQMAVSLINQLKGKFDISKYKDTYSSQLMDIIKAKAKGKKPKIRELKVVHSKSKDLMDQLKESLKVKQKRAS